MSKIELTRAQRQLAEYRLRTADVQEWVAEMCDGEKVVCEHCGQTVGVKSMGWHRDRCARGQPAVEDAQADWDQADADQWGNQEHHWQSSTRRGE